jgi:catechol 2,3-dioxygenase-like lactoylglutathione lyase family enzyme
MIGYALVGSNDLPKALDFYDQLLATVGAGKLFEHPSGGRVYGSGFDKPFFGVVAPFNGKPATVGNGTMISLAADSRAQVDAVYRKAMELGATDEGAPGLRGQEGESAFYGAYFRDLDGNKLCVFRFGPA